ncbi:MAG: hypothetical protein IKK83_03060 [Clostridia bacterium]|nr:hypothetical protein [Clostridia bacterium]
MNYIGRWKLHSVMTMNEECDPVYISPEEYLNSPMPYIDETDEYAIADEMKERRAMVGTVLKICEDGKLYMLVPLPEGVTKEQVDEAVASGEIKLMDGAMCDDPMAWEERDGEFWFDTGIEGEVYGEKADSWVKPIDENGFFNFINFRFIKED